MGQAVGIDVRSGCDVSLAGTVGVSVEGCVWVGVSLACCVFCDAVFSA